MTVPTFQIRVSSLPRGGRRFLLLSLTAALAVVNLAAQTANTAAEPAASSPPPTAPEEALKLDPFVIREDDNVGYSANSTLAGTRINTALRDVGASISIITPEFLADTAATNMGELLSLTTSTEVGGVSGNFAGGDQNNGRPDQSESRENPQGNNRVRGIGAATTTRDYFITDIPFDSYNTSRVTISRGPNSLLFGIGNPAGIIEASTVRPLLRRNRTEIGTRYGSNDSYRATLDLNRVIEKDRIAFRIASVSEQNNFAQKPAFDRKRRLFAALEFVLRDDKHAGVLGKTTLRTTGELGDSQSTPVNIIPPINAFGIFFQPPNPAIDDIPGVTVDPRLKIGSPTYLWKPRVTVDNRASSSGIAQNFGGYYAVPYFIQVPLIWDTPGQAQPGYAGSNNPALAGLAGIMGRIRYAQNSNGRLPVDAISTANANALYSGFVAPTLQNRAIFDYRHRLISGGSNRVEQTFQAGNLALSQELFNGRGGIELAYDQQKTQSTRVLPFSFGQNGAGNGQSDIYIDVSQYLSNDQPNPNLGRPFMQQLGIQDRTQNRGREAFRATAFYKLDLEDRGVKLLGIPLGNHTVTGLYNSQRIDVFNRNYQIGWDSNRRDLNTDVFQAQLSDGFRRSPVVIQYLGPSALNAATQDDVRLTNVFNGRIPRDGEVYNTTFFDFVAKKLVTEPLTVRRFLNGGSKSRQLIGSQSISLKSDFFKDTLVSVVGWRWDNLKTFSSEGNVRLPDSTLDLSSTRLRADPDLDERGHNLTWSLVGRLPRRLTSKLPLGMELSGYYNASGNFNPQNVRTNLNGKIIPAPAGTTQEYGILTEFFDRRVSLRVNWFHTLQTNSSNNAQGATGAIYGFPNFLISRYVTAATQGIAFETIPGVTAAGYTSYQQLYAALFQLLPEPTKTLSNLRFNAAGTLLSDGIQGLTDTSDLDARGLEAELVGNLTRRWRVSFNVAKQETVVNGSARLTKQVADAVYANLQKFNLLGIDQAPALPERQTAADRFASNVTAPLAATVARDGAVSPEQRKWRANFVTTYDLKGFEHPVLKAMSVGTAVRWQQKVAIGNPFLTGERLKQKIVATDKRFTTTSQIKDTDSVMQSQFPDLDHPFYGPQELAGDFWVSYRRRVFKTIDWRLQLNVRNAWGNDSDIPVTANPDGSIAVIRIPNETRWTLSSTFSF
jgi:outer membrane receptor protein involved in Fe transport